MAKKTVSVPVVHKKTGKEDLPKRGFKILTKFRQENVSGLEKVDRIIPTVKDIISIKQNCKATAENVLDQLNQQDIHKENIHLLLEKRIIEHCQCKRDHQEQELLKIGITEKLHDCLSLFESVLQMLGLEYCKDASSSVGIVLPRLLENFKNLLRHHKNVDLLTTHEDVDKVLKKDVDELNEKIKIQEENNAKLRNIVHMLMKKNAVKMAMMFHGNNGNLIFDYQTEEEEENVALDQAINNLCTTTCEFLSYGANQITQMAKVKQHEMEQLDLIKEKIKKHMVKREKEAVKNSNFIVNKYYARKHELQLQIDQLQNENNRLIASIIKKSEGVFSNIYGNNYKLKYNNQAHSSLMVLLETLVKNRSNMAVILRKIFTNERSHPSFSDFHHYEDKINEAELLLDKLCSKADMLYTKSIQLDKNIAETEEEIKKSKSKMKELQNGVDYYEKDVKKENSLKSQLLLAKEAQKIMDAEIELVNGELYNLECARQMQLERLKYKKRYLKKLYRDFLTMKNSNKDEGKVQFCKDIAVEAYGAHGRGEHHRQLYEEIGTLFNQLQSAISENLKVKEIEYSTHKKLDQLKYELNKELDEIREKRMKIFHLECQYKIKHTADVDEKDLSNSDTDHHTSPSEREKLLLSCISEKDIVHANDEIQTLKSEEKETGELSMRFSGIKQVNEIHTLLNEMEECSKIFQQLAESEKESAHHVSNDFISISEEILNGSSFFTDAKLESGRKFQNEKAEESISKTAYSSAHAETTAQSFSEKSHSSKTGKHESDSENPGNNGGSMLSATAVVAMLEIAVQRREPVVFYHHMKGQNPSFLEITTLSNFILQQKNSFYNAL
ncbi:hypothetical protein Tsp_05156 [Trichinella spiralis]|uniref:hypothetical protein n=1 Tax=Trichinella spiralis TaxID=6334 RepID=UPI0001EFD3C7|nr:hypothetical protein Tsp_05156 [Trichinella spiralis]